MQKSAVSLSLIAFTWMSSANALASTPSFADLKWFSTKEEVQKQMQLKQYKYLEDVEQSNGSVDKVYRGKLLNNSVDIMNYFNKKGRLVRTKVIFSANTNLHKLYTVFKENLENKYGEKNNVYIDKTNPGFRSYDALFQSELKSGKNIFSTWTFDEGYVIEIGFRQIYVSDPNYQLTIDYYSIEWDAEADDRTNQNDL